MYIMSRKDHFAKLFFLLSVSGLTMYVVLAFYTFHTAFTTISKAKRVQETLKQYPVPEIIPEIEQERYDKDLKYILLWTIPNFKYNFSMEGQQPFIKYNCRYLNCYVTTNKQLLDGDVKNFDAVVFSISTLRRWKKFMPKERSHKQKYVFYSMVPAKEHPVCNIMADYYFNWTWSYKLYSDIVAPFIEVKDLTGKVVAPSAEVEWSDDVVVTLNSSDLKMKAKAVMWHIEKCDGRLEGMKFAKQLQAALKEHSLSLDIFGCGMKRCPVGGCLKAIEMRYNFYLAHEEIITEDYVTTEVLKAYQHNAVPIVMGGADYTKFLPPGSYIDASTDDNVERIAAIIAYSIRNPSVYYKYFIWKDYYTINEANIQDGYCQLCSALNDRDKVTTMSSYDSFRKWWYYGSLKEKCLPKGAEKFDEILSYINDAKLKSNLPLQ